MNDKTKAIVYVRGSNKEMQEIVCRVYASCKGYSILFVTDDINDVNKCDTLFVTDYSRITRNKKEFDKIMSDLKDNGVDLISVSDQDDSMESIALAIDLFKNV